MGISVFKPEGKIHHELAERFQLRSIEEKVGMSYWEAVEYEEGKLLPDELDEINAKSNRKTGRIQYVEIKSDQPRYDEFTRENTLISRYIVAAHLGSAERYHDRKEKLAALGYSTEALDEIKLRDRADYLRETIKQLKSWNDEGEHYDAIRSAEKELAQLTNE